MALQVPSWGIRAFGFVVAVIAFQGLVVGETLLEEFPDPSIDSETSTEEVNVTVFGVELFSVELPNFIAFVINFMLWPFAFAGWLFGLMTLAFIPGIPTFVTLPLQIFVGVLSLILVLKVGVAIMEAVGANVPFT